MASESTIAVARNDEALRGGKKVGENVSRSGIRIIINQQQVGDLPAAIPPIEGQRGIIAYIDTKAHKVNAIVNKICESISKLGEHCAVLISAAVTGKIDVRKEVG